MKRLVQVLLLFSLLQSGCYAQGGTALQGDDDFWRAHALDACNRGDLPAYEALYRRQSDEEPPPCSPTK